MLDSHAHYDLPVFDDIRDAIFAELKRQGINKVILPGTDINQIDRQLQVAKQFDCGFGLGIHPWNVPDDIPKALCQLEHVIKQQLTQPNFVAIGECGLDKLRPNFAEQQALLVGQLQLAQKYDLPVILHCVKSHDLLLKALQSAQLNRKGVVHGFYGAPALALRYVKLGYKLGIGDLLLNHNAHKLKQTVETLPLETLLVETDTAQLPHDDINNGEKLHSIVKNIAQLQNISTVLAAKQLDMNALQLYDL
ncbi:TatD family hydrolase [Shewanella intestini]|uniref:TatD family hydrolase n=1 Tax=Shewanella intestini TaxID=2017544 RepID=A0ABS5HXL0_9GAMM|nr:MULTISPECIES: TatD family hydrolase [Shewanella]MBR9726478.1 TatD family hydrolase [Shewanella intestini]